MTDCSRWNELIESLKFHVDLAASSGTTAQFRFLNNAAPVTISPEDKNVSAHAYTAPPTFEQRHIPKNSLFAEYFPIKETF